MRLNCYLHSREDFEFAYSSRAVCTCCKFFLERVPYICTIHLWALIRSQQKPLQLQPDRSYNLGTQIQLQIVIQSIGTV